MGNLKLSAICFTSATLFASSLVQASECEKGLFRLLTNERAGILRTYELPAGSGIPCLVSEFDASTVGTDVWPVHPNDDRRFANFGVTLDRQYVYIGGNNELLSLKTTADGGFEAVDQMEAPATKATQWMAIDFTQSQIVAPHAAAGAISTVSVDDGQFLSRQQFDLPGEFPHQTRFWLDNETVYVPKREDNSIGVYSADPSTGSLVETGEFAMEGGPRHMAFGLGNKAYVIGQNDDSINVVTMNGSELVEVTQKLSIVPAGTEEIRQGSDLAVSTSGRFIYTLSRPKSKTEPGNEIGVFKNNWDGTLSFVEFVDLGGADSLSLAIHPNGGYVYVVFRTGVLQTYQIDRWTGKLTLIDEQTGMGDIRQASVVLSWN